MKAMHNNNMDLQLFAGDEARSAEAVQGKQIIYLFRVMEDAATDTGTVLAFTTENENSASADSDSIATKDGAIQKPGVVSVEITGTAVVLKGNAAQQAHRMLGGGSELSEGNREQVRRHILSGLPDRVDEDVQRGGFRRVFLHICGKWHRSSGRRQRHHRYSGAAGRRVLCLRGHNSDRCVKNL